MKKFWRTCVFLLLSTGVQNAAAQVVDMRAFSRQRGFKAYQAGQNAVPSVSRNSVLRQTDNRMTGGNENLSFSEPSSRTVRKNDQKETDQTDEFQKYIADNPQVRPDI